jgi:urease accessory protein
MYDAASLFEPALQRATGDLQVSVHSRDGVSALQDLHQAGCLKARFPRRGPDPWLHVVTVNTSGGIVGGDRLHSRFVMQSATSGIIASQAAERVYRALSDSDPACIRTRIELGAGAAAEWLPQETILFDRCALDRRLDVEMAADSRFLGLEMLVFGRTTMGETMSRGSVSDVIRLRRAGRLILHDAVRLHGNIASLLQQPAIAAGAGAMATVLHVAPDAEGRLDAVRAVLASIPGDGAASAWDGMLVIRLLSPDSASLRNTAIAVLRSLRGQRTLPRTWGAD